MQIGILIGAAPLGSTIEKLKELIHKNVLDVYIIALDGGIMPLYKNSLPSHEWIGDMDSFVEIEDSKGFDDNENLYTKRSVRDIGKPESTYINVQLLEEDTVTEVNHIINENVIETSIINRNSILSKYPELKINQCSPIKDYTDMELGVKRMLELGIKDIHIFGGLGGKRISHTIANIQMMHKYCLDGLKITAYDEDVQLAILSNGTITYDMNESGYISIFSLADISKGVRIKGFFYEYEGELENTNSIGQSNEFCGKSSEISVENGSLLIIKENK